MQRTQKINLNIKGPRRILNCVSIRRVMRLHCGLLLGLNEFMELTRHHLKRMRKLYFDSPLTIAEIIDVFGLTQDEFDRLCKEKEWGARCRGDGTSSSASFRRRRGPNSLEKLLKRTRVLLGRHIDEFERELDDKSLNVEIRTSSDRERESRTLASFARTIEKLFELEKLVAEATAPKAELEDGEAIEQIRTNLERRLSTLIDANET